MLSLHRKLVHLCSKHLSIRCVHDAVITNNDEEVLQNVSSTRKNKKSALLKPRLSKTQLKNVYNISSIVVSTQELSCLTMNRHFELTNLRTIPFPKFSRSTRHDYYKLLYPLVELQSNIDVNVIEHHILPPKYDWINLHIKSVVMMMLGMFEKSPTENRVTFACRSHIGNMFDLNIKKTESRKCSKDLATEIVLNQKWNGRCVYVPNSILVEHGETICYTERLNQKLINYKISAETADAFIQAIGFWEFVNRTIS